MSEEEIIKQYANGIVDIDKLVGSLIDKFKTDKTSVDIQQLQLVAEYLIYKADKLQKENQKLRDIKNKAIGHINSCRSDEGILSKDEIRCLLEILKVGDIE